jgi:hypothetical protein
MTYSKKNRRVAPDLRIAPPAEQMPLCEMGRMLTGLAAYANLTKKASQWQPPDLWQSIKNFWTRPEIKEFF